MPVVQWYRNLSLVARFTWTGLALTIIVGSLVALVVGQGIERAALEHEAWSVSETVAQTLGPAIAASDFEVGDHLARAEEIRRAEEDLAGHSRIRELRIWSADSTLIFGPELEMIGFGYERNPALNRALRGEVASVPVLVPGMIGDQFDAGLQTFAPIRARDASVLGAFEIQHSTVAVTDRIHAGLRTLWLSVTGGLLLLYFGLFGIVKRASAELEWHHREVIALTSRREIDRMKAEFASTVSHELRAPLTSLIGYSELLVSRGSQHGQDYEWAEQILRQSKRLSELLDDVLGASMIADSAMMLTPRTLDVPAIVARAIGALPGITPTIAIEAALPPNLPSILGDREKLMQILTNLLTNAVKYSPDGGEIRISAAEVNGRLRLSVIDHGLGIAQNDLPRLFERFHRIHARTNPEIHGTGLGLYISRGLAELQGGILWGESQGLGMGSAFHLELPLAPAEDIAPATVGRPSLAIGAAP